MKLSVALCTYNGDKYLSNQLESIFDQSHPVDEVIITDDISKDGTSEIVSTYQKRYPGKVFFEINSTPLGAKKNFEKALSRCTGDIIFLSDQDDIWTKEKVKKIVAYFFEHPQQEAVFTDALLINDKGEQTGGSLFETYHFQAMYQNKWERGDSLFDLLSGMNRVTGATMAVRKSLLLRALPFDLPKIAWHDAWLAIHAAVKNTLGWINEPLTLYRVHAAQQIGVGNGTTVTSFNGSGSLRELLESMQLHETEWLKVTNMLLVTYPSAHLNKFKIRKLKVLRLIKYRLSMPAHPALRLAKVVMHLPLYYKSLGKPLRSIARDILKPAR